MCRNIILFPCFSFLTAWARWQEICLHWIMTLLRKRQSFILNIKSLRPTLIISRLLQATSIMLLIVMSIHECRRTHGALQIPQLMTSVRHFPLVTGRISSSWRVGDIAPYRHKSCISLDMMYLDSSASKGYRAMERTARQHSSITAYSSRAWCHWLARCTAMVRFRKGTPHSSRSRHRKPYSSSCWYRLVRLYRLNCNLPHFISSTIMVERLASSPIWLSVFGTSTLVQQLHNRSRKRGLCVLLRAFSITFPDAGRHWGNAIVIAVLGKDTPIVLVSVSLIIGTSTQENLQKTTSLTNLDSCLKFLGGNSKMKSAKGMEEARRSKYRWISCNWCWDHEGQAKGDDRCLTKADSIKDSYFPTKLPCSPLASTSSSRL